MVIDFYDAGKCVCCGKDGIGVGEYVSVVFGVVSVCYNCYTYGQFYLWLKEHRADADIAVEDDEDEDDQ